MKKAYWSLLLSFALMSGFSVQSLAVEAKVDGNWPEQMHEWAKTFNKTEEAESRGAKAKSMTADDVLKNEDFTKMIEPLNLNATDSGLLARAIAAKQLDVVTAIAATFVASHLQNTTAVEGLKALAKITAVEGTETITPGVSKLHLGAVEVKKVDTMLDHMRSYSFAMLKWSPKKLKQHTDLMKRVIETYEARQRFTPEEAAVQAIMDAYNMTEEEAMKKVEELGTCKI